MKHHSEQQLDKLAHKLMSKAGIEKSTPDFTDKIMAQIEDVEISMANEQKPLISRTGWALIGLLFSGLMIYSIFGNNNGAGFFDGISIFEGFKNPEILSNIQFSETLILAMAIFAILFLLQIGYLKSYFSRRLQY